MYTIFKLPNIVEPIGVFDQTTYAISISFTNGMARGGK
jgi:hypothetical protein